MPLHPDLHNRQLWYGGLLAATLPIGLLWRLAPLHMPPLAFKYGGSALWAIAVYWVLAMLLPHRRPAVVALWAYITATAVECFKLVYWSPLDRFRDTLAGKLLLGRYFTVGAMVAYWLAIALAAWADARWLRRRTASGSCSAQKA